MQTDTGRRSMLYTSCFRFRLCTGFDCAPHWDGFFGIMRSDEMQQPMRVDFPLPDEDLMAIADGVENDENIEELAFDYEW